MSGPQRLKEEGGTSLELALLGSARDDDPPPDALPRAMLALGVSGAAMAGAGTSSILAKPAGGLLKWAINLIVWSAAGLAGGALFNGEAADPAGSRPSSGQSAVALAGGAQAESTQVGGLPAGAAGEVTPEGALAAGASKDERAAGSGARSQSRVVSHGPRPRAAVEIKKPTLAEEVALLDSARRALTAGDVPSALQALERHAQTFQGGALTAEAAVLRIEALTARGDKSKAMAQARAFLSAFPKDPHATHVQNLLQDHQAREPGAEEGETLPK